MWPVKEFDPFTLKFVDPPPNFWTPKNMLSPTKMLTPTNVDPPKNVTLNKLLLKYDAINGWDIPSQIL